MCELCHGLGYVFMDTSGNLGFPEDYECELEPCPICQGEEDEERNYDEEEE